MKENILMIGGAGFIGSHTADLLVAEGHRVRILDILDPQIHGSTPRFPAFLSPRVEKCRGDARNPKTLRSALEGIDSVFHFAARTGVGQSMYDRTGYVDVNVGTTAALLDTLLRRKKPLRRLVLSSSRAVYGEGLARCAVHREVSPAMRNRGDLDRGDFSVKCPDCRRKVQSIPTPETKILSPGSVYAVTKKHQEDLCLEASRSAGLSVVILRYFNVYGSRQALNNPYTGVATVFFNRLRGGQPIALYESGLPTRDFIHVSDVAQANRAALFANVPSGSIFNVGSGKAVTIRQLAETLGEGMSVHPRWKDDGEFRVGDILACTANISRSAQYLRWTPRMNLREGMMEFIHWAVRLPKTAGRGYERTVQELKSFRLFGGASGKKGNP